MKLPATDSLPLRATKVAADLALWGGVGMRRAAEAAILPAGARPTPRSVPITGVLGGVKEVEAAVAEARALRLPRHPTRAKNWDGLGAVRAVVERFPPAARVLDAGAARYSTVLPSLRLYGFAALLGLNLEFCRPTARGPVRFRYGDITATGLPPAGLDAVTCMSVIEHGVDVPAFLAEVGRVLRPGGLLVLSTDYDSAPQDVGGLSAYGEIVHIFDPDEIHALIRQAATEGLQLVGRFAPEHAERPVHWTRHGLDYTFVLLTFERRPG